MIKKVIFSLAFVAHAAWAQDPLTAILKTEIERNHRLLKEQPVPAYYMNYRVHDTETYLIRGALGALTQSNYSHRRQYAHGMRVGDHKTDNRGQAGGNSFSFMGSGNQLILENDPLTIRTVLWEQTDQVYKNAVQEYEKLKANKAVKTASEDQSDDFSVEKAEKYYEKPVQLKDFKFNAKEWEEKVKKYSKAFADNKDILIGEAILQIEIIRKYFVDSDGAEIVENHPAFRLFLQTTAMADDGMELPLHKSYFARDPKDLPSDAQALADVAEMSRMTSALKKAPIVESFSGPAILTAEAAGVFFHEIFGHRIEGARLKQEQDAQTFKKKIGEQVLPKDFTVLFDPQLKKHEKTPLNGSYVFDDEGVRGQKVVIVKDGILQSFLMSRTPIEGFPNSNGHGRGVLAMNPVTRQSNMIITSSNPKSEKALRALLIEEINRSEHAYGYLFGQVSGGFTQTGRYSPNVFNVTPLVVYRIYADGRPDELVRGVNLVGTPLAMFSQIEACGDDYAVFNGMCGAESGTVPVACVSPSLYVKRVETQKKINRAIQPPLLERP
jgi:predicted Zn-dependent protease